MMSISQVDMVVWRDSIQELQVCGDLSPMAGAGDAPSSTDPQSFTVVVRQGDNVATLHAAGQFDRETFDPKTGRWELKGKLGPEDRFDTRPSALVSAVSAVVILKREPAGLETLSWVQPVKIKSARQAAEQQLEFHPEVLAQPDKRALAIGHSVSSSLAILQDNAAGGDTFIGLQRIDKVPPAVHATP
jgi:hypothetical protein